MKNKGAAKFVEVLSKTGTQHDQRRRQIASRLYRDMPGDYFSITPEDVVDTFSTPTERTEVQNSESSLQPAKKTLQVLVHIFQPFAEACNIFDQYPLLS